MEQLPKPLPTGQLCPAGDGSRWGYFHGTRTPCCCVLRCPGPSCATARTHFVFPNNLVKVIDILTRSHYSCLSLFKSWGLQALEKAFVKRMRQK